MKIIGLEVDGFGIWHRLKLESIPEGLSVFYGPNEAGKTTLMQFVRTVLYGFSSERRQRYLPPIRGGSPGGSLHVTCPNGRFQILRQEDDDAEVGVATLVAADGTQQGEYLLKILMSNVDEAIFNNVFAVGLREMQELGTLSDTQAAEMLYNLTAGVDRISLVEVIRQLGASRQRLLADDTKTRTSAVREQSSVIVDLIDEREKLRDEIRQFGKLTRRFGRLAADGDRVQQEITRREEDHGQIEQQIKVTEIAIAVKEKWQQRADLDAQISELGPLQEMPRDAVGTLEQLNKRLEVYRQRREQLKLERRQLKQQFRFLRVNEALWRQSARIEALAEQHPWMLSTEKLLGELASEVDELETSRKEEFGHLGLDGEHYRESLHRVGKQSLGALRLPARAMRETKKRLEKAKRDIAENRQELQRLRREIQSALAARGQSNLNSAMQETEHRVETLRRRVQLDERLDQMRRQQSDLEDQSRQLLDRQMMPIGVLTGLGGVFVLGVVLILCGLLFPASITGSVGWALALLGAIGAGAAGGTKFMLERSAATSLESCQKQCKVLDSQIRLAHEDRQQLDELIPRGGGPLVSRLQSAEKELAALEELLPMDAGCQETQGQLRAAVHHAKEAQGDLKQTRQRWSQALAAVDLPETLSPKQVGQLSRHAEQLADLQRRLDRRREELNQRRREYATFTERISQLLADAGLAKQSDSAVDQLRQLATELADQQASIDRRQEIRHQAKNLRRKEAKYLRAMENFQRRKRRLILDAGTDNEQQFRSLALQQAHADTLRKQREQLHSDMVSIIQGQCSEKAIEKILEGNQADRLEQRWEELGLRLQEMAEQLKKCFELRGQLNQQIKALTEDRTLGEKQLELGCVERRLADACERWQTLAATELLLEEVRKLYEENRQPETLQEASGYLNRLTAGRYTRVWTPLGESVLRVDDAQGNSLSVEVLSRGTREQLFMSLRLALVSLYARRGTQLPLILDDVLVNFDAARAKAAVAVLRDFAKAGHQLLVFTCHEHIRKLFKSAKVAVQELPKNDEHEMATIAIEPPQKHPKKRHSRKRKKPAAQESPEEVSEGGSDEKLAEEEPVASEDEQDSPEEINDQDATEVENFEDSEDDQVYEVDSAQEDYEDYDEEEEEDYEEDEYEEEDDSEQSEAA